MRRLLFVLVLCLSVNACKPPEPSVFQEVIDQGGTRFFNKAKVSHEETDGNVTAYTFDKASGPMCLAGADYTMSVRDKGSDGLFIFLQGGGACWSKFCLATVDAPPGIPEVEILDAARDTNPLKDWSTVYLPYCDGSLFVGEAEWSDPNFGAMHSHGLKNLSAALDIAVKRFPHPKRIVLAGSSGGGYGTIMGAPLVRIRYPGVPIDVFDDSGLGLGKADDPQFIKTVLKEFNAEQIIPASCTDCSGNGHITKLVDWELKHDPQLKISVFSSFQDSVLSTMYLKIDPLVFQSAVLSETQRLHDLYPDRYHRFLVRGEAHTALLGDVTGIVGVNFMVLAPPDILNTIGNVEIGDIDTTTVDGVSVSSWFKAMIDGTPEWVDRVDAVQ